MSSLHPDAKAIDRIGGAVIRERFNITRQAVFYWRRRGVPREHRNDFAALARAAGCTLPKVREKSVLVYRIYALSGSDGVVRYVGKTKCTLAERARGHLASAKSGTSPLHVWVNALGAGLVMKELEVVEDVGVHGYSQLAADRETWWIADFLSKGADLFNMHQRPKPDPCKIIPLEAQA